VIDASVMPAMVSTNTNAAAIMIGERGAALVRGEAAAPGLIANLQRSIPARTVFPEAASS
jgi:choline dehydrogenase-like flavoprotein